MGFWARLASIDWTILSLKLGVLLFFLWVTLRIVGRFYGVHNTIKPNAPVWITKDAGRRRDGGESVLRLPLRPLRDTFGATVSQFNGGTANVMVEWTNSPSLKHDLGSFILEVPERHTHDDYLIDRDTWEVVRAALEPGRGRGPPRQSYNVRITISGKRTRGVRYLLFRHPNREARQAGIIVLLTGLLGIASAVLFSS